MADITFDEILRVVPTLTVEQKRILAHRLNEPTRENLIAELEALRAAGAFKNVESMRNRYATPQAAELTDEQLEADIREASTAWEQELDEFFRDDD